MKKPFAYVLSLLVFVACQTQEKSTLDINNMNLGWLSEYDSISHHIAFNDAWGGRGWLMGEGEDTSSYADMSEYDLVTIKLKDIEGPVSKINLIVRYTTTPLESRDLCTIVDGATTIKVKLNEEHKDHIKGVFLLCDTTGEMTITDAYFEKEHKYGERKELNRSEIGMIMGDQFDGYTDNALVEFTFETKGELVGVNKYGETVTMYGWVAGMICSIADIMGAELPTRCITLRNVGTQTYACELGDLRYLLSLKDDDGECGIYWTVWTSGGLTEARVVKTTIAEAID